MLDNPRIYKGHIEYFGQFDASKDKPTHIGFTIPTRQSETDTKPAERTLPSCKHLPGLYILSEPAVSLLLEQARFWPGLPVFTFPVF